MTKVLLTFTGFHDPFSPGVVTNKQEEGPILTVIDACQVDRVFLISTSNTAEITQLTKEAIGEKNSDVVTEIIKTSIDDPTDYFVILSELRRIYGDILPHVGNSDLFVSVTSGTPQMHACWLLLATAGEIPARLLQSRPARYVNEKKPIVNEFDCLDESFPTIRPNIWSDLEPFQGIPTPDKVVKKLEIVGQHPSLLQVIETSQNLSNSELPILISGETGTGKEQIASLIHGLSPRHKGPFVIVNCSAIPANVAESTLFGHCKGAFTDASENREGKFKAADQGTIFLDEVGELPKEIQPKLLRALEQGEIEPVGSDNPVKVNVRVVSATHRNLEEAVQKGEFRQDLLYRLKGAPISLPALRDRSSDITPIACHFLDKLNRQYKRKCQLSPEALTALQQRDYPGNVRQLRYLVERAMVMCRDGVILPETIERVGDDQTDARLTLPSFENGFNIETYLKVYRHAIYDHAVETTGGNNAAAARLLGVSPTAVGKYLKDKQASENDKNSP